MHFPPLLTLFVPPVLCSALIPPLPSTPSPSSTSSSSCAGAYPYNMYSNTVVTFREKEPANATYYRIATPFATYYPRILMHALRAEGFEGALVEGEKPCVWRKARTVYGLAGWNLHSRYGDILSYDAKLDSSSAKSSVSTTTNSSHAHASRSSDDTIAKIAEILQAIEPAADVYRFCNVLLYWTITLLACTIVILGFALHIAQAEPRGDKTSKTAEIELNSLEVAVPVSRIPEQPSRATVCVDKPDASYWRSTFANFQHKFEFARSYATRRSLSHSDEFRPETEGVGETLPAYTF